MDYGCFNLQAQFPLCRQLGTTSGELAKAVTSEKFGRVFSWTLVAGLPYVNNILLDILLGDADIDGIIYGFMNTHYYDHRETRMAAKDIIDWITRHPDKRYIATQNDKPW